MNPLLLRVDELKETSQPWEAELSREFIDGALAGPPPAEYTAADKSKVEAEITKMGREVLVRGRFTLSLNGQCKRCLKPLLIPATGDFTLNYVPTEALDKAAAHAKPIDDDAPKGKRKKSRDDDEAPVAASFSLGNIDVEVYGGKSIDLSPAVREQILLALPPSPLCTEDCKGLCPTCGKDLNEGDCGHRPANVDPRWQALKTIQLDTNTKTKE